MRKMPSCSLWEQAAACLFKARPAKVDLPLVEQVGFTWIKSGGIVVISIQSESSKRHSNMIV